jgi:hypothetical protein
MAKDDQQEAFERALSSALTRVIDFIKFAEAKNAALLTFSSAWIIGSVNFLTSDKPVSPLWRMSFTAAVPIFTGAAIIAILSFIPRTNLGRHHKDPERAKSLLYFGDAATFEPSAFRDRIRERYYPPDGESAARNYLDDLSVQIAVNSQIAARKFSYFNTGALFVLAALALFLPPSFKAIWDSILTLLPPAGASQ